VTNTWIALKESYFPFGGLKGDFLSPPHGFQGLAFGKIASELSAFSPISLCEDCVKTENS